MYLAIYVTKLKSDLYLVTDLVTFCYLTLLVHTASGCMPVPESMGTNGEIPSKPYHRSVRYFLVLQLLPFPVCFHNADPGCLCVHCPGLLKGRNKKDLLRNVKLLWG